MNRPRPVLPDHEGGRTISRSDPSNMALLHVTIAQAVSSLILGVLVFFHLTVYPPLAYALLPGTVWGGTFMSLGMAQLILVIYWQKGRATPGLSWTNRAMLVPTVALTYFSFMQALDTGVGYYLGTAMLSRAYVGIVLSRAAIWRFPGGKR